MLSKRASTEDGDLSRFRRAVTERQKHGALLLDLTNSNPTQAQLNYDWSALRRAIDSAMFHDYAPDSAGERDAREAIVRHLHPSRQRTSFGFVDAGLSHQYRVDNLVLTSSTSEAYSYLFKLLCDPGDVILVPEPSYPLFEQLARYEAVTLASYQLRYDGAWFIDTDSLRQLAKLNPKAIVVVTPNNPTGSCVSPQELQALCSIGAPLIVDQVFAPFVRADASLHLGLPLESDASLVFTLDGLSKRCALPQLKLAWTAVSGSAIAVESALRGLNHIADAFLSPNTLTQRALNALLNCSQQTTDSIRCRLDENWRTLQNERARGWPVSLYHYQGGWAAMWRFPSFRSDDDWAHWCLERGVLVQPGWLYDCSEPSTLVVSLLTPPLVFAQAVQRLAESLASE